MFERTESPDRALSWATTLYGDASPFHFFTVPERFGGAERTDDTLWLTIEHDDEFGISAGPTASPLPHWRTCLIVDSTHGERAGELRLRSTWDFYTRRTEPLGDEVAAVTDAPAITALLERDAPRSSVWPGSESIVAWYGVYDGATLCSVAALTQWRSGYHVVSSVATADEFRGRGLARRVMRGVVSAAHARGVEWLGLGVAHSNHVAQRLYRDTGFTERARFSRYGLLED